MQAKFNGQKVRTLRKMKKLSQAMLAEQGDTSERYIRDLERGQKRNPSASVVCSLSRALGLVPFPVSWTVKMKKKQKETQDILSYHSQAAGCSDKARAKASGGRQPIEECGRTGL